MEDSSILRQLRREVGLSVTDYIDQRQQDDIRRGGGEVAGRKIRPVRGVDQGDDSLYRCIQAAIVVREVNSFAE